MTCERGNQMKDYLERCLEAYNQDRYIFSKALKMINFYMNRIDWPNCIEELDRNSVKLLGQGIMSLTWGAGQYIGKDHISWDGIPEEFRKDYIFFCDCIGEVYNRYWQGRFYPNRLSNVSYTIGDNNLYNIRFGKNNNEKIDVEMEEWEIERLISNLKSILGGLDE